MANVKTSTSDLHGDEQVPNELMPAMDSSATNANMSSVPEYTLIQRVLTGDPLSALSRTASVTSLPQLSRVSTVRTQLSGFHFSSHLELLLDEDSDFYDEDSLALEDVENISNEPPVSAESPPRDSEPAVQPPTASTGTENANDRIPTAQHMTASSTGHVQIVTPVTNVTVGIGLQTPPQSPPREEPLLPAAAIEFVPYYPTTAEEWHEFTPNGYETAAPMPPQSRLRHNAPKFVPSTVMYGYPDASTNYVLPPSSTIDSTFPHPEFSSISHPRPPGPYRGNRYNLPRCQSWMIEFYEKRERQMKEKAQQEKDKIRQEAEKARKSMADQAERWITSLLDEPKVPAEESNESTLDLTVEDLTKRLSPIEVVEVPTASQDNSQQDSASKLPLPPSVWPHDIPSEDDEQLKMLSGARWTDSKFPTKKFPGDPKNVLPLLSGKVSSNKKEDDDDNASTITNPYEDEADHNDQFRPAADQADQCDPPNGESSAMAERRLTRNNPNNRCRADPVEHNRANGRTSVNQPPARDGPLSSLTRRHESVTSIPPSLTSPGPSQPTPNGPRVGAGAPSPPTNTQRRHKSVTSIPHSLASSSVPSRPTPNAPRAGAGRTSHPRPVLPLRPPQPHSTNGEFSQQRTPTGPSTRSLPNGPPIQPSPQQLRDLGARDSWGLPTPNEPRTQASRPSHPAPVVPLQTPQQQPGARDFSQRPAPPAGAPTGPKADKKNRMNGGWRRGGK